MLTFVFIVLPYCYNSAHVAYADNNEPSYYSRFDYDMKMFETVADTKHNQKTLMDTVEKLEAKVAAQDTANNNLQDLVQRLEAKMAAQEQHVQDQAVLGDKYDKIMRVTCNFVNIKTQGSGSSYVRWGRTSCPGNTTLIYKGYVGGSHYSHTGSGADYQCLPDDPTWGIYQDGLQSLKAFIYGTEYEHFDSLHDKEVPCAVCLTTRSPVIMIPARTSCYSGWSLEYEGNLASDNYKHRRTHYKCIDKEAEAVSGTNPSNNNGALFYAVEGRCGALPCPPYVEGRELACVVCSK